MTRSPVATTAPVTILMAACAGVVDLWAITSLGGSYAGVVTGNLVTVGRAIGEADPGTLVAPLIAVAGFAIGVALWSAAGRRWPDAVAGPLAVEIAVLAASAVVWPLTGTRPGPVATLVLLGLASLAMGGQSSVALRLGESTTYLTGTLTGAVAALVGGGERRRVRALRQLAALVAGAAVGAVLLEYARWAVPLPAVGMLVAALGVWLMRPVVPVLAAS